MMYLIRDNIDDSRRHSGIVLLITLVLLVVLATVGYTLTCRLVAQRHRSQYIIDYQAARYGCDSGVKYALATLENITPTLVERPNEPDFSDLFYLSEEEYNQLLAEWAEIMALQEAQGFGDFNDVNGMFDTNDTNGMANLAGPMDISAATRPRDINATTPPRDINDINGINDINYAGELVDFNDPNSLVIRGPYGPPWPLVTEPLEFEVGSAQIKIEVEDENAKYPISWMLLDDEEVQREALAGFETFCEWMDVNGLEIESLEMQLEEIKQIKPFKLEFKEKTVRTPVSRGGQTRRAPSRGGRVRRRTTRRGRRVKVSAAQQFVEQSADLSRLFHSSLIDTELLARPTILSDRRKESALKYMAMWGSKKVNINTASRQVLEAAFTFGGDAVEIAEGIIQRRRIEPFKDIDDLKSEMFGRSESIRKCEKFITTSSDFFTVRVTAVSGVAEASAVIAIIKQGAKATRVAIITG
ncbi:MAG: type II secretion system protein GspK [Planctomycetota bacterium]|jgi:hypothetical protein